MQRWDPLSDRQFLLLKRIGEGDDLSGSDGVSFRISARGLQSRRLVTVSRRGGTWRATINDAGRFYLEHGFHPDHPDRRSSDVAAKASARHTDPRAVRTTDGTANAAGQTPTSLLRDGAEELIE